MGTLLMSSWVNVYPEPFVSLKTQYIEGVLGCCYHITSPILTLEVSVWETQVKTEVMNNSEMCVIHGNPG